MCHSDIISTLLQYARRDLANNQIKVLGKLSHRSFQHSKKQFVLPFRQILKRSRNKPVRLILDYVLIDRKTEEISLPFNDIYNHNTKRCEPTLYVLFVLAEMDEKFYPIAFDFWLQKEWTMTDAPFISKIDLAESLIICLHEQGLNISEVLFDAGFCSGDFLTALAQLEIPYVCRFPYKWKVEFNNLYANSTELFRNNRKFYYDRFQKGFIDSKLCRFGGHNVRLVAIARTRERLDQRKFYCIITNQIKLRRTQVLRRYLRRGKIEWFFKQMKSYLGLNAFYRHDPDTALIPHFNLRAAGFIILQEYAHEQKKSLFAALTELKSLSSDLVKMRLKKHWEQWAQFLVDTSTQDAERILIFINTI